MPEAWAAFLWAWTASQKFVCFGNKAFIFFEEFQLYQHSTQTTCAICRLVAGIWVNEPLKKLFAEASLGPACCSRVLIANKAVLSSPSMRLLFPYAWSINFFNTSFPTLPWRKLSAKPRLPLSMRHSCLSSVPISRAAVIFKLHAKTPSIEVILPSYTSGKTKNENTKTQKNMWHADMWKTDITAESEMHSLAHTFLPKCGENLKLFQAGSHCHGDIHPSHLFPFHSQVQTSTDLHRSHGLDGPLQNGKTSPAASTCMSPILPTLTVVLEVSYQFI